MKKREINLKVCDIKVHEFADLVLFIRMPHCKTFRVWRLPEEHEGNEELKQVLCTLSFLQKNGVYYFHAPDEEVMEEIMLPLELMGIPCMFFEPDSIECKKFNLN